MRITFLSVLFVFYFTSLFAQKQYQIDTLYPEPQIIQRPDTFSVPIFNFNHSKDLYNVEINDIIIWFEKGRVMKLRQNDFSIVYNFKWNRIDLLDKNKKWIFFNYDHYLAEIRMPHDTFFMDSLGSNIRHPDEEIRKHTKLNMAKPYFPGRGTSGRLIYGSYLGDAYFGNEGDSDYWAIPYLAYFNGTHYPDSLIARTKERGLRIDFNFEYYPEAPIRKTYDTSRNQFLTIGYTKDCYPEYIYVYNYTTKQVMVFYSRHGKGKIDWIFTVPFIPQRKRDASYYFSREPFSGEYKTLYEFDKHGVPKKKIRKHKKDLYRILRVKREVFISGRGKKIE